MHGLQVINRLNAEQIREVEARTSPKAVAEAKAASTAALQRELDSFQKSRNTQGRVNAYIDAVKAHDFDTPMGAALMAEQVAIDPTMEIIDRFRPALAAH